MANAYVQLQVDSTGKKVQTFENTISGNVVESQGAVLVDSSGVPISSPTGYLRASAEPSQLFLDSFDTALDTAARWNAAVSSGGGVAAVSSSGALTLGTGTTASGYSHLSSQATFPLPIPGWLGVSSVVKLESPITANTYRFWGSGTVPGTPSAAAPLTDAVGFEVDIAGKMYAVVYAAGVRTVVQDLSTATGNSKQPTDALNHRYIIQVRTDKTLWFIDAFNENGLVATTTSFQSPNVQALPVRFLAVANTVAPASSGVITCSGVAVWDTAHNNNTISDGTFGWRKATVKPASTAPVATDTSLVVALSPNSSNGVQDITATGTLGALNAAVQITPNGLLGVGMQLAAGTLIGTIIPEVSFDGGTTWVSTLFDDPLLGNKTGTVVFSSANPATARSLVGVGGAGLFRVRVSAYTSGTANITIRASQLRDPSLMAGGQPGAAILPPIAFQMGGSDGTNFRALATTTLGQPVVSQVDGYKATYTAAATNIVSGTTAQDIFTITGSASKTIRVNKVVVTGTQTTAGIINVFLLKRSTANSAGTSTAQTAVPHDSNSAAASATVLAYTVNPTAGTLVGNIRVDKLLLPAPAGTNAENPMTWEFGIRNSQAIVLRGTGQVLAVNLGGVTVTGGSFDCYVEWTEE